MRLIVMGTGPFAVPTFRELYQTHHEVAALVTGPLRHRGKRGMAVSPMRDVAHEHGTDILDPEHANTDDSRAWLARYEADLLIVCDYGQILAAQTLATARLGGINLHASLLPKYRGAAPINWALYRGETTTGVSVIHMTPKVDAGPVIAQGRTPIEPDETAQQLEPRLAEIGSWLVRRAIDSLEAGRIEALPQDPKLASRAPRLKKSDGLIDWNRPGEAIRNHVRAMVPWPKTHTFWHRPGGDPLRVIVATVSVHGGAVHGDVPPGTVVEAQGDRLLLAAGDGLVKLEMVQPAGKRQMPAHEFLRGYRVRPGERFGPE